MINSELMQVHNLPKNYLETLSHARYCVKEKKVDVLKLIYGNVPDTLSQLIRTGQAVGIKGLIIAREVDFDMGQDFLTIKLPSERKLFYAKPFLQTNEMGREALYYRGINQEIKKWESIATYGGKLTENIVQAIV